MQHGWVGDGAEPPEGGQHGAERVGRHGWRVVDCAVTMTHSGYAARQSHAHGVFDKSMSSTAADFRALTPIVLMRALRRRLPSLTHGEGYLETAFDRYVPVRGAAPPPRR